MQLITEETLEDFWQAQLPGPSAKFSDTPPGAAQLNTKIDAAKSDGNQAKPTNSHAIQQSNPDSVPTVSSLPNARTNLLVQRLYRHKLDQLVASPATVLCRCLQCGTMFAALHRHKFPCSHPAGAGANADLHVISSRHHVADKTWKAQRCLFCRSSCTVTCCCTWYQSK